MTLLEFNAGSDAHIMEDKPSRALGGPRRLAVDSAPDAIALIQFPLGQRIGDDDDIVSAKLRVYQDDDWSGTYTLTAQRVGKWKASKVTWDDQPALTGVAIPVTQSDTSDKALWEFDVTTDVQAFHAGSEPNYGWQIRSDSPFRRYLRGFDSGRFKPVLVVEVAEVGAIPSDLRPSGGRAVSTTQPMLKFFGGAFSAIQVQIAPGGSTPAEDANGTWTAPSHDSGTYATTVPQYDLAETAYALSSGSAQWHVRALYPQGWSEWSEAHLWTYAPLPSGGIINPDTTTNDPTPPTIWTAASQEQRRVVYTNAAGKVLEDSGWATTDSLTYTPGTAAKILTAGKSMTVRVEWRDDVERESNDNGADFAFDELTYTYVYAEGIAPVTWLTVTQEGRAPSVRLRWMRAESADRWAIERAPDGSDEFVEVMRIDAADAATTVEDVYEWTDWTCPPNRKQYYRVRPVVNGELGDETGTEVTYPITVRGSGLWIADPETGDAVVVWGQDPGSWGTPERSAVYETMAAEVIRHVYGRRNGPEGAMSGVLVDVDDCPTADECEAQLQEWAEDPSLELRMIAGHRNVPAHIGDINTRPSIYDTPEQSVVDASWSFWPPRSS